MKKLVNGNKETLQEDELIKSKKQILKYIVNCQN